MKAKVPPAVLNVVHHLDLGSAWISEAVKAIEESGPGTPDGIPLTEEELLQAHVAVGAISQLRKRVWEGARVPR